MAKRRRSSKLLPKLLPLLLYGGAAFILWKMFGGSAGAKPQPIGPSVLGPGGAFLIPGVNTPASTNFVEAGAGVLPTNYVQP